MRNKIGALVIYTIIALCAIFGLDSCRRSRASSTVRTASRDREREVSHKNNKNNTANKDEKMLNSVFEKTVKYWQYDEAAYFYNYSPQERLKSGRGVCWDYALYFYNECQAKGIENVHFVVSNKLKHAWNEVWVNNTVFIIDATWADTNPYESIETYFMVNASKDEAHYEVDICVVDDTMAENDISALYRGQLKQDTKRQKYTADRPIVKLKK